MPLMEARTSSRRFTLLKDFSADEISVTGTPQLEAKAAAAVAFHTLYSPPKANSKSAQYLPSRNTVQRVRSGSRRRLVTRHIADSLVPYRSTGQNAFAKHRSMLLPESNPIIRPRPGTRFTNRLKAVSTASRSL